MDEELRRSERKKKLRRDARDALKRDEIMFHGALQEDLVPLILDRCVLRDAPCKTSLAPAPCFLLYVFRK